MIEIPTPAEIAEANRVKDEAEDDRLLEEWLPVARKALLEYRGRPVEVPLPGCTIYHAFGRIEIISRDAELHDPSRFMRRAIDRIEAMLLGREWVVGAVCYPRVQHTYGRNYDHTTYPASVSFTGREDYDREMKGKFTPIEDPYIRYLEERYAKSPWWWPFG